ncbi:sensor histidine kinase [Pseudomonas typographi]|uniref:Signal transduction histidine-protein kinase/phosphatase MprB n=1 Tax=Pseudomonas typographi TaxID=2715964 RepID=A0ABR7Z6R7_9PSED|nr:sensor histidine kinase [Pseudomonas typographi]MBD1600999.1 sensor histidine kinase [Pseudomonas typographi]
MKLRHSLLWKLALVQVAFCLLLAWLLWSWGLQVERNTYFLPRSDRQYLADYAAEAEDVWDYQGAPGLERWRVGLEARERTWAAVLGPRLQSLTPTPLSADDMGHLTFMRKLDWPMSRRLQDELPYVSMDFPRHPEQGRLVMQLPERLLPAGATMTTYALTHGVVPALLALALGVLLYRLLVAPLAELRERANALRADNLDGLAGSALAHRADELGELARAFEHMTLRVRQSLAQQRQLLRTLSHEIRTPLARLRIAGDSPLSEQALRGRLGDEVDNMQRLVDDSLNLAWLDTERPHLNAEPVVVASVWEALVADACFEQGWAPERLPCQLGADCVVRVHLDSFAQALENLLRNAMRHSTEGGRVTLAGQREGGTWHLTITDQGPGVPASDLERIFEPYVRLDGAPGQGFGLGLSIARKAIALQGGELWACPAQPGLRMHLRLPAEC